MNRKTAVWVGLFVGSAIGGFIPSLWGAGGLVSFQSVFGEFVGALAGIYLAFKLSE